jgi:hypothetical protein
VGTLEGQVGPGPSDDARECRIKWGTAEKAGARPAQTEASEPPLPPNFLHYQSREWRFTSQPAAAAA